MSNKGLIRFVWKCAHGDFGSSNNFQFFFENGFLFSSKSLEFEHLDICD